MAWLKYWEVEGRQFWDSSETEIWHNLRWVRIERAEKKIWGQVYLWVVWSGQWSGRVYSVHKHLRHHEHCTCNTITHPASLSWKEVEACKHTTKEFQHFLIFLSAYIYIQLPGITVWHLNCHQSITTKNVKNWMLPLVYGKGMVTGSGSHDLGTGDAKTQRWAERSSFIICT